MFKNACFIVLFSLLPVSGFASTKLTIVKTEGNSTVTTQHDSKQMVLRNEALRGLVKETASFAIELDWDEGQRSHQSFRNSDASQFYIDEMTIKNGVVMYMSVTVHGNYTEYTYDQSHEGTYSCQVDLERYEPEDNLLSEYAVCETDLGEEIEYEN